MTREKSYQMPGASEWQVILVTFDDTGVLVAVDDTGVLVAVDDTGVLVAVDDKRELVAFDDKEKLVAFDDKEELVAIDDKWELVAVDDKRELVDSSHAAAAAAAMPETTRLRIGFRNGTSESIKKKVMANVGPWFTNKGYEVECDNANTFYITCQPKQVEKLLKPSFPHRMKGETVDFHLV